MARIVRLKDLTDEDLDIIDELDDEDMAEPVGYSISSYGVDYPVDGLVKRLNSNDILIPKFQRQYVWNFTQASRFIESLLMGLPVPGVFMSKEPDTRKHLVIDGQQRLRTLQYFYTGIFGDSKREFALRGVQPQFKNATYRKLKDEDRRKLDDSIIHATVVQQDEPDNDDTSIYYIFERLNTGGTLLTPQEIRACVYHGNFNILLKELNENKAWREIFGSESRRMRDCELILRFFALYFMSDAYEPPMNNFLNKFMKRNKSIGGKTVEEFSDLFNKTIQFAFDAFGRDAFRPKKSLNAAVFDSVMVALAKRLQKRAKPDIVLVRRHYKKLLQNPYFAAATEKGTATVDNVASRIRLATEAFS